MQLKQIKRVRVADLRKWELNTPHKIKPEKFEELKRRILDIGFNDVLKVAKDGRTVLGGNTRLDAIAALGFEEVDVLLTGAETKEEMFKVALSDNQEFAQYDREELRMQLAEMPDLDLTGYELHLDAPTSLVDVIALGEDDVSDDDFDVDEAMEPTPISQLGETYQLGDHLLVCGDSTSREVIRDLMQAERAAVVFTDPPYNVNIGHTMKDALRKKAGTAPGRTILNDHFDDREQFYIFLRDSIMAFAPFAAGGVYIAMSSSELDNLQRAFRDAGGHWSTFIIWVKNHFTLGRADYQRQYEPILYGWFEGSSHYWSGARNLGDVIQQDAVIVDDGVSYLRADNLSTDIWEFPKPTRSDEHPTMKPIALVARALVHSSQPNDVVLDPFGGSGTTIIAAEQLKRRCRMVELDPKYCDVIRKRWARFMYGDGCDWQQQTPTLVGNRRDGETTG